MLSLHRLTILACLAVIAQPGGQNLRAQESKTSQEKPQRTDSYGDPLPEGAIARLGTARLRHKSIDSVAFSPDNKMIASAGAETRSTDRGFIHIWDAATGRELRVLQRPNENAVHVST